MMLRGGAIAVVIAGYAVLAHLATSVWAGSNLGTAIALLPLLAALTLVLWRTPRKSVALLVAIAAAGGLFVAWPFLRARFDWLYFLPNLGSNAFLAGYFGRTLLPGEVPLITRFAALVHDELNAGVRRYTRQVTVAWTLFFVTVGSISTGLFVLASPEVWSVFANLLSLPLIVAMFLGEYLVRVRVLPPEDRPGIIDSVRAYFHANTRNPASPPPAR